MVQFDQPINSNDQSLERVLKAGLPAALVFHTGAFPADLRQALDQAARQHAGQLLVVQIPARENPESVRRFGVQRFPGLVMVRDGQPVSQAGGFGVDELQAHLNFLLGQGPKPEETSRREEPVRQAAGVTNASAGILHVSDQTFEQEVVQAGGAVLVDFWAAWCGPCRQINPILEKLSRELTGRLRIVKVNVDETPRIAGRFGVQSIPTMMIFKNGQLVDRWVGALPEVSIRSRVNHQLK